MIKETVARLEKELKKIQTVEPKKRAALLKLLAKLKGELHALAKTHGEEARSIAGFTELAAHEATRKGKKARLRKLAGQGLEASVKGFEATHPTLVDTVNEISLLLARIGI